MEESTRGRTRERRESASGGSETAEGDLSGRTGLACPSGEDSLTSHSLTPVLNSPVCVYSFHPLVLSELQRLIEEHGAVPETQRLDPLQVADLASLTVPPAAAYVIEANTRNRATEAIVEEILSRYPDARLLVVAEKFDEPTAFPLLRVGVKGLLCYSELSRQLVRAIDEVAGGGFWVPRTLLSRFVDWTLAAGRRPRRSTALGPLSPREREVHELLMENLSNKEIAKRLHMSERTVKFHVSNLLGKHGVKRRADLILLAFSQIRPT
jgi:DNA-binding NarL/FixJ family response regulator